MMRPDNFGLENVNVSEEELDQMLQSEGQLQVRDLMQSMREDSLSLSWRSELNEELLSVVKTKQRKRRFAWILSPALGLGVASVFAFMVLANSPEMTPASTSISTQPEIEERLIATYQDSLRYSDITGVGLNPDEVVNRRTTSVSYDLVQASLDSL